MTIGNVITTIRIELDDVRGALLKCIEEDIGLLRYKPHDGGWSSLEVLEHITLTSHYLLKIIDKASAKAMKRASAGTVSLEWENYILMPTQLYDIGVHRSFVWDRPAHMRPSGKVLPDEIRKIMIGQFDRCGEHLDLLKNGEGRLCRTTMSVNDLGKLDVYQYIYFLVLHAKRHITQMEKNKTEFQLNNKIEDD